MYKTDKNNVMTAPGTAQAPAIFKAGCGIRIDPADMNEEIGFDFSGAEQFRPRMDDHLQPAGEAVLQNNGPASAD